MAARESVDLTPSQYQNGNVDFLRLVDSERTLVRLQDELAASRGQIALKLVAIYNALGGGWQTPPAHDAIIETPPLCQSPASNQRRSRTSSSPGQSR